MDEPTTSYETLRNRDPIASTSSSSSKPFQCTPTKGVSTTPSAPPQPDSSEDAAKPSSSNTSGTFECHICLDAAQNAVVSMCGHLFCWPCLYRWLETARTCPVCKSAISADKVVPLYGRGSDHTHDPRSEVPPRPAGHRVEPEPRGPGFSGVFNNLFGSGGGTAAGSGGIGMNNMAFPLSVGIGLFPFGFMFNFTSGDGGANNGSGAGGFGGARNAGDAHGSTDAEIMSKFCLLVAIFCIGWLLLA